jgi:hypothetical protein
MKSIDVVLLDSFVCQFKCEKININVWLQICDYDMF